MLSIEDRLRTEPIKLQDGFQNQQPLKRADYRLKAMSAEYVKIRNEG